jgi:hypothetical protein
MPADRLLGALQAHEIEELAVDVDVPVIRPDHDHAAWHVIEQRVQHVQIGRRQRLRAFARGIGRVGHCDPGSDVGTNT